MAARLLGRELTLSELRGIVQGIKKIMETDNETDKPKLLAANVGR